MSKKPPCPGPTPGMQTKISKRVEKTDTGTRTVTTRTTRRGEPCPGSSGAANKSAASGPVRTTTTKSSTTSIDSAGRRRNVSNMTRRVVAGAGSANASRLPASSGAARPTTAAAASTSCRRPPGGQPIAPRRLSSQQQQPQSSAARVAAVRKAAADRSRVRRTTSGTGSVSSVASSVSVASEASEDYIQPLEMSALHAENRTQLTNMTRKDQVHPQRTVGKRITDVAPEVTMTPIGLQPVLQKVISQKLVERSLEGEHVTKHLTTVDLDESTGRAKQVELDLQKVNPKDRLHTGAISEAIEITSSVLVTPSHTKATKNILREIKSIDQGFGMKPDQVAKLVEEENDDVETTMSIVPPDLIEASPEKYGLKKRLQKLRLNSESVAFLEQSVMHPPPVTADEAEAETPPEALAKIMHSVEKGVTPNSPPNQLFKALFAESKDNETINVSSVSPGPLSDVVIPTEVPSEIFEEAMDSKMEKTIEVVQRTVEKPSDSMYFESKPGEVKAPAKPSSKRTPPPSGSEKQPYKDEDFQPLEEVTGAVRASTLEALDLSTLDNDKINEEMTLNGIEYFLDAEAIQYVSRVQLRGSQLPSWFPGYMLALPEIQDVIKISSSPSSAMLSAWKAVQPKVFPEDSIVTLDL